MNVRNEMFKPSSGDILPSDKRSSKSINEKIDLENTIDILKNTNHEVATLLIKVKSAINLLLNKNTLEYLIARCYDQDNGGKIVRTGSFDLDEYRITAIRSLAENTEKIALIFKYCPVFGYLRHVPGSILSFSVKILNVSSQKWETRIEIGALGNFGKEFSVKMNFFTYN